jgi:methanethiol S-methyltransferase
MYIILIMCWAVYFFIHSFLAADRVKEFLRVALGGAFKYYRVMYNALSVVGLVMLLFLNASIPSNYLIDVNGWTRYFSLMLATLGIFIVKAAFKQFNLRGFMGFKEDANEEFKAEGILKHIRHPLYAGTILIAMGFWLFTPNITTLLSVGCIFTYLAIGIPLEERKLINKYGEPYRAYRKKVQALIPKVRK